MLVLWRLRLRTRRHPSDDLCVRPAQALPDRLETPRPSHHVCARVACIIQVTTIPPQYTAPLQPHATNRRLPPTRLELTMFMLALPGTLPESASRSQTHCLKPQPRHYYVTVHSKLCRAAPALHSTDIDQLRTPCSFFRHSSSLPDVYPFVTLHIFVLIILITALAILGLSTLFRILFVLLSSCTLTNRHLHSTHPTNNTRRDPALCSLQHTLNRDRSIFRQKLPKGWGSMASSSGCPLAYRHPHSSLTCGRAIARRSIRPW